MEFKAGQVEKLSTQVPIGRKDDLSGGAPLPQDLRQDLRQDLDPNVPATASVNVVIEGKRWTVEIDEESDVLIVAGSEQLHFYKVDLGQSLAGAIESAFDEAWRDVNQEGPPMSGKEDRRILYVAVARGVLSYLKKHAADGFVVDVEADQKAGTTIASSGETTSTSNGGGSHTHQVTVEQEEWSQDDEENRITCVDEEATLALNTKDINNG